MELSNNAIFTVYRVHPQADGQVKRQMSGRFVLHDGLHVLEDHFGDLAHLKEGEVDADTQAQIEHLQQCSYLDVVAGNDVAEGNRLDLVPERDFSQDPPPPPRAPNKKSSVFTYTRDGQEHQVVFKDGECFLDSQHLDAAEAQRLLEHHKQGIARLRYQGDPDAAQ